MSSPLMTEASSDDQRIAAAVTGLRQLRDRGGRGVDTILPGLYVGSLRDAQDSQLLQQNKIGYIVSILDFERPIIGFDGK